MSRGGLHIFNLFRISRILKLAAKSLWLHKLRAILTVLGIVFGVCSVIAMLAIGEGASYEAKQQIKRLGSQNIIVKSVKPPQEQSAGSETSRVVEYGLTYDDAERFAYTIPNVDITVPMRTIRSDLRYLNRQMDGQVIGTVPWYPDIANAIVRRGRFISSIEMHEQRNVCVIGAEVAKTLFAYEDPKGKAVRIDNDIYEVIGIMAESGETALRSGSGGGVPLNINRSIFIPLTAARSRFGELLVKSSAGSFDMERVQLHGIIVKVDKLEHVMSTSQVVTRLLKLYHKKEDYEILVPLELLREAERTKRIFNIVLGSIAAISLLVGGIGFMNIMLATVTERTREIGIRRALGAKRHDIIMQFLTETVVLSAAGGVIGIALGISIPFFITRFSGMATIVVWWAPFIAFCISAGIGIVFGIYPARRAANMDPIEALRHE